MSGYNIINTREIIYSTGNLNKALGLFEDYGGWNRVGRYKTNSAVLLGWNIDTTVDVDEVLLQSDHYESGQVRIIQFHDVEQRIIRSSQQPWDVGGIMDINLRVHEVEESFEQLREMGWHGLSDPMLQEMGPFKLYDILMRGYDDIIIAFTHRLKPPMNLTAQITFPTHVYKTSITVNDLEESKDYYINKLGCTLLTEYEVVKDKPQENMFGLPHNLANQVVCKAVVMSMHGDTDTDFQIVKFEGITGKDFTHYAKPPHKGFLMKRIELEGLQTYTEMITNNGVTLNSGISRQVIEPYGLVDVISTISPEGVWIEFFERVK